ncbi:hypothetical protein A7R79_22350 [Pseudomonas aeruginosa]|nr:hypothetical protein [Pseudomonas aeruginosa]OES66992.1 hypothetical protein A7R79_22350 [Pseudomonas aeruginosa]
MSIDWSKAPRDANKAGFTGADNYLQFYRIPGMFGDYDYWSEKRGWCGNDFPTCANHLFERPATVEWNGKGLPPVGTVCEYRCNDSCEPNDWTAVHVLAHAAHGSDTAMLLAEDNNGEPGTMYGRIWVPGTCRPLRTPEQIAAEGREKAIDAMLDLDPPHEKGFGLTSRRQFCEVLFDAGYRRQEEGK